MNPFQQQGAFSWCELMTSNTDAAKQFYQQLFGWLRLILSNNSNYRLCDLCKNVEMDSVIICQYKND